MGGGMKYDGNRKIAVHLAGFLHQISRDGNNIYIQRLYQQHGTLQYREKVHHNDRNQLMTHFFCWLKAKYCRTLGKNLAFLYQCIFPYLSN